MVIIKILFCPHVSVAISHDEWDGWDM
jgi:hypothetical protein